LWELHLSTSQSHIDIAKSWLALGHSWAEPKISYGLVETAGTLNNGALIYES